LQIISHRGFWQTSEEKNTIQAFERSFLKGFGVETDLRDLDGVVVISHDPPRTSERLLTFEKFLSIYKESKCTGILALNVKADGLQKQIKSSLDQYQITNYVLFDMSIPDTVITKKYGLKYLSRYSDIELELCLFDQAAGVWMDEFSEGCFSLERLQWLIEKGKPVFVVSPELHGRDHLDRWGELKDYSHFNLILCTDFPDTARDFFGE
jgi:hypothetical protein